MGDTIPGFVVFIGGLVIAALIVSVGFYIYNNQKETSDAVVAQTNRLNAQLQEAEWTQYDGMEVMGSEIVNVIKRMKDSGTYIQVGDASYCCPNDGSGINYDNTTFSKMLAAAKRRSATDKPNNASYINPSGLFIGEVKRDENGTILGIVFTPNNGDAGGGGGGGEGGG